LPAIVNLAVARIRLCA